MQIAHVFRVGSAWLRLALFAVTALVSAPARADLLTVQFETYGEEPPSQLCVIADFSSVADAGELTLSALNGKLPRDECHELEPVSRPLQSAEAEALQKKAEASGAKQTELHLSYFCRSNPSGNGGTAWLRVPIGVVTSAEISRDVARLNVDLDASQRGKTGKIELLGYEYYAQSPISERLSDVTQLLKIPLVPRCTTRTFAVPDSVCKDSKNDAKYTLSGTSTRPFLVVDSRHLRADVLSSAAGGSLVISHCEHSFQATWSGPVPPLNLAFETQSFGFRWKPNCLSPPSQCPTVVALPGASISCKTPAQADATTGMCEYTCTGSARFPVALQLAFQDPSAALSRYWNETLGGPGQVLFGYIPEEQRRVQISWAWAEKDREVRANITGDEINYTELRTPEGTIHRLHHEATEIRVPELDCADYISYRYVGTRTYREEPTRVDGGGGITLKDPREFRIDRFALGAALGGGERHQPNTGQRQSGAQGEVQVIAVFRHPRDWFGTALDAEIRMAALLSTQPYCTSVKGAAAPADCSALIPYWRFPLTIGLNWQVTGSKVTLGAGLGAALTGRFWAADERKLNEPSLFTWRAHVGYKLSRTISVEGSTRVFYGEAPQETVFDDAGVRYQGAMRFASTYSEFFGVLVRVDDVL